MTLRELVAEDFILRWALHSLSDAHKAQVRACLREINALIRETNCLAKVDPALRYETENLMQLKYLKARGPKVSMTAILVYREELLSEHDLPGEAARRASSTLEWLRHDLLGEDASN